MKHTTAALWATGGWLTLAAGAGAAAPAVLFHHGVHSGYVVRPLVEMGVVVNTCPDGKLAETLATRKYNVLVTGLLNAAEKPAVEAFLAEGGGVLVCNPRSYPREADFTLTCEWLAGLGARPRWELLQDTAAENVVRDVMGCALSFSDLIAPAVNEGVTGVLTLTGTSSTGWEPPMSYDLSADWRTLVRGAATMHTRHEMRNDLVLQPWLTTTEIPASPPLLAAREAGKGRLAVCAIRDYWLFTPPPNCPTAEAMLTAGAGGKPSQWLRVFANTFAWLAEPSAKAGYGGATTPEALVHPPVQVWEPPPLTNWAAPAGVGPDQTQTPGLIGARTALSSGEGTVAEFADAAKAAGLHFLVFLEDSLKMDQAAWDKLVAGCNAASDDTFAAIPGLTYEDAQGNHLYAFADNVQFPKDHMLLPDRRLATVQPMRSRAYFDYVNELVGQHALTGFWRHRGNFLPPCDYKLYNSFPIKSLENGKPVDDALDDYLYLMGLGGCQAALAFEIMDSPQQVAARAAGGWRVVAHRPAPVLRTKWHEGAWSFSGSGSQYITNGPAILVWQCDNRLISPSGLWWRPDQWQMRLRLRVASDKGLKSVTVVDGHRGTLRRWLPQGAPRFEQEIVLSNDRQTAYTLLVEDTAGRQAVSMTFWNRNCLMEEFFCSDRCNFLGNARLRTRSGQQVWTQVSFNANMGITPSKGRLQLAASPAVNLTLNSPTLPIDGAPAGLPTVGLDFYPRVPGELPGLYAYSNTYLVGAEIAIGQTDHRFGYDPAERGAEKSPLGHPYQQPQEGWGNAWGGWHRLIPTRKLDGWSRIAACNWLPETFRIGWVETDARLKEPVEIGQTGLGIMNAGGKDWTLYADGQPVPRPADVTQGEFRRGVFATLEHSGGNVVLAALDGPVNYRYHKDGTLSLWYRAETDPLPAGSRVYYRVAFAGAAAGTPADRMLGFARAFGIATPGATAYAPEIRTGKTIENCIVWRADGGGVGLDARIPRTDMPGFLPVAVEGLNDGWSVQLLDRARPWPNHRALPVRDGRAFAQLDLCEADGDLFIGHPVVADNPAVRLQVAWQQPGVWYVEAHNPTDQPVKTALHSPPGWTVFAFKESIELAPGTSRTWQVKAKD
ncbi:MAG: hypothetical protein BWZ02_00761 [Lentisphaerae bacterium ADurb.BinA184]|nr:MAG: hypothetical protein BWZ02_00761 [Lentisphaerae bacterium ADurb.BinA184]